MELEDITINKIEEDLNLLIRHIKMLRVTKENQPIGIIRLSEMTGIPKHKVRYSLKLLEKEGTIRATSEGAVVTDSMDPFMDSLKDHLDDITSEVERIKTML